MITPAFGLTATERVLPKLALDFTTASLDSRITFTRTTGASNPATYVNSSGLITAATNNQPRFDYDPVTLACKGLLIEESRQNVVLQSQSLATTWVQANGIGVSLNEIAPDSTTTAATLTDTNPAAYATLSQNITVSSTSATWTASIFVKKTSSASSFPGFSIVFSGGSTGASAFGTLNTNAGTATARSGYSFSYVTQDFGTYWRYSVSSGNGVGNTTVQVNIYPAVNTDASGIWSAATQGSCVAWGVQAESGAFATSYIPTTTTALTRNADVATMTGTNFSSWFNASEGTFVAQYIPNDPSPSNARGLFIADDGTGNNLVGVSITTSLRGILSLATSNVGAGAVTANSGTVGQVNTVAGAYKVNDYAAALNGGTVATSTTLTLPTVTQARIGFLSRTGLYANATIQKLAFYPVRGINAQVQAQSK